MRTKLVMFKGNRERENSLNTEINMIMGAPGKDGFKIRIQRCADDIRDVINVGVFTAKSLEQWRFASSAKKWIGLDIVTRSLISTRKVSANMKPCGTLTFMRNGRDRTPSTWTELFRLLGKPDDRDTRARGDLNASSFTNRRSKRYRRRPSVFPRGCRVQPTNSERQEPKITDGTTLVESILTVAQ